MNNFNNIVVGLDISNHAQSLLNKAFLIAKRNNSKVVIAHAIDVGFFGNLISDEKIKKLSISASKSIEKELQEVDTQDIEFSVVIEKAKPSELIIKVAKEIDASLIVIRANEEKELSDTVLGSTAHNVAQMSHLPILIVKNASKEFYKNIVAFTDLSEVSQKCIVFTKEFFSQEDISCVHIHKKMSEVTYNYYSRLSNRDEIEQEIQTTQKEKFDEFVKHNDIKNAMFIEDRVSVKNALSAYVDKNNNDLVALGSRGVNSAGAFLYGSTTSTLMQSLKSDVLVYIPKK